MAWYHRADLVAEVGGSVVLVPAGCDLYRQGPLPGLPLVDANYTDW